jgi:hypothetical protein
VRIKATALAALAAAGLVTAGGAAAAGDPGARYADEAAAKAAMATFVAPGTSQTIEYRADADTIVRITRETIVAGRPADRAAGVGGFAASAGCWIGTWTTRAADLGVFQFSWRHYVHWCGNGSVVTSYVSNQSQNLGTGPFWNWRGPGEYSEDIRGSSWRAARQGRYELCYPGWCFQSAYPRHLGTYRGNGTWSTLESSQWG